LRTPDERFADLPDYPFAANYVEVDCLHIHHLDVRDVTLVGRTGVASSGCASLASTRMDSHVPAHWHYVRTTIVGGGHLLQEAWARGSRAS
jgi:hypothetical protein